MNPKLLELLKKLATTKGTVTVDSGMLTFEDGEQIAVPEANLPRSAPHGRLRYQPVSHDKFAVVFVFLNGEQVGRIRHTAQGWQYVPKRHRKGGEYFPTLGACRRSLEEPGEGEIPSRAVFGSAPEAEAARKVTVTKSDCTGRGAL